MPEALQSAKEAAQWIIRKMNSEFLLVAGYRKQDSFAQKGDLSNQIYLFDNGMVMIGLLNLYKITERTGSTQVCNQHGRFYVKVFF